jgi:hypothetical protein
MIERKLQFTVHSTNLVLSRTLIHWLYPVITLGRILYLEGVLHGGQFARQPRGILTTFEGVGKEKRKAVASPDPTRGRTRIESYPFCHCNGCLEGPHYKATSLLFPYSVICKSCSELPYRRHPVGGIVITRGLRWHPNAAKVAYCGRNALG